MEIINYQDITLKYGDKTIIDNINLTVNEGEFISIIGSSGSGKTSLIKMVNGMLKPSKGTIKIHDKNISTLNLIDLRRSIGYAVQGNVLFPHLTIKENIMYVPNLEKNKVDGTQRLYELLDLVSLDESLLDRYPDSLSGGQQQRVGIARALAANPKILLMDEPFSAVDEITRRSLQEELKKIHQDQNLTILFVTHDINEALLLGTKVLILNDAEIQQFDTPEETLHNPKNNFVRSLLGN